LHTVNFFAAFMPGVRELRTPLAVGALWLTLVYVVFSPTWPMWIETDDGLAQLVAGLTWVNQAAALGAIAFIAYLVGSVALPVSSVFAVAVIRVASAIDDAARRPSNWRWVQRLGWRSAAARSESALRGPIADTVAVAYSKADIPSEAALSFPLDAILGRLDSIALQLWKRAPTQYQEYDRLRAESTFRSGVGLPIAALGAVFWIQFAWWAGVPLLVGALVLVVQTRRIDHERSSLVANALYQELATSSTLEGVTRELVRIPVHKTSSSIDWNAATAVALWRISEFELAEQLIEAAVGDISDRFDDEDLWEIDVSNCMKEINGFLARENADELKDAFQIRIDRMTTARKQPSSDPSVDTPA
jgi:hypothetical protein